MAILNPFSFRALYVLMVLLTLVFLYGPPARGEMEEDDKKVVYRTVPGQRTKEKVQEAEELNRALSHELLRGLTIELDNRRPPRRDMKDPNH